MLQLCVRPQKTGGRRAAPWAPVCWTLGPTSVLCDFFCALAVAAAGGLKNPYSFCRTCLSLQGQVPTLWGRESAQTQCELPLAPAWGASSGSRVLPNPSSPLHSPRVVPTSPHLPPQYFHATLPFLSQTTVRSMGLLAGPQVMGTTMARYAAAVV